MTASPRSPSLSPAPNGTARASLASGTKRIDRRWRPGHEGSLHQTGPLCDLYAGLYRAWWEWPERPGASAIWSLSGEQRTLCGIAEMKRMVESRCGAVALGRTYLLPPLSSGGALVVPPWLRFHIPLIEPDRQISRIRLSDKTSRCRVQRPLQLLNSFRS